VDSGSRLSVLGRSYVSEVARLRPFALRLAWKFSAEADDAYYSRGRHRRLYRSVTINVKVPLSHPGGTGLQEGLSYVTSPKSRKGAVY
jgi:hypothetical protein